MNTINSLEVSFLIIKIKARIKIIKNVVALIIFINKSKRDM